MIDPPDDGRPLPPPPVEPLPDLAWARLERQIWQALDAPAAEPPLAEPPPRRWTARWRYPLIAAGAIAAAGLIAIAWPRDDAPRGGLVVEQPQPSRVATADAPVEVNFGDSDVVIAPRSTLLLRGDQARGVEVLVERGRASFAVAPRAGRAPYVVRAGAVQVTVVGTAFTVVRDGEEVQVEVEHGVVEVVAGMRRDRVAAGQVWDRTGARNGTLTASAKPAPSPDPDLYPDPDPNPDLFPDPDPNRDPDPSADPSRSPDPSPGSGRNPSMRPNATPDSTSIPTAVDPKAAFAAAAALEVSDPRAAMAAYRKLAVGRSAWAANALFAAARLAYDRDDRPTAKQLAQEYLKRFPRGRNAADAHALLERL